MNKLKLSILTCSFLCLITNQTQAQTSSIILYEKIRDYIENDTTFYKELKRLARRTPIPNDFKLNTSMMIRPKLRTTLYDDSTIFIDPRIERLNNEGRDTSKYRVYFTLPHNDTVRFAIVKALFNENKKILFIENVLRIEGLITIDNSSIKKVNYQFKYPDRQGQAMRVVFIYKKEEIIDLVKWINYYNLTLNNDTLVYDLGQLRYVYEKEYTEGVPNNYNPEIKYYLSEYMLDNGVNVSFIYIRDKDRERLYAYTYSGHRYEQYFYLLSEQVSLQTQEFKKKVLEENLENYLENEDVVLEKIFNYDKMMLDMYSKN